MRIERIDDSTVKLFITYKDIESRGFKREDLWSNRKRGEEFFWMMMEEINQEEDFVVEGPLWIQVHAFEKGVEVTVSKSKNEDLMNMSDEEGHDQLEYQVNELLSQSLKNDEGFNEFISQQVSEKQAQSQDDLPLPNAKQNHCLVTFEDLDTLVEYAHRNDQSISAYEDLLYMLEGKYYYYVHFDEDVDDESINDFYGQLLEFAKPNDRTLIYLEDYAKIIMSHNVINQVKRHFDLKEDK